MKKQFNLEYYLSHPEVSVVTRDGRSASDKYREEHNPDCEGDYFFIGDGEDCFTIEEEEGGDK